MRRNANRPRKVAAERQMSESYRECRRAAAAGSTGRSRTIPWIVRRSVDIVEALPVAQHERHIGVAKNDGARIPEPPHSGRIARRAMVFQKRCPAGGRHTRNLKAVLDRHGHAQKLASRIPLRQRIIGRACLCHRGLGQDIGDGVQRRVEACDALESEGCELLRRNLTTADGARRLDRRDKLEGGTNHRPATVWENYGTTVAKGSDVAWLPGLRSGLRTFS